MSVPELSRFDELVSRYLDDALTDSHAAELLALLAEPPLAARFLETTRLNSEIAGLLAAPVPDAAMVELVRADIQKSLGRAQLHGGARLHLAERTQPRAPARRGVLPPHPIMPRPKRLCPALAWAAGCLVCAGLAAVFITNRSRLAEAPVAAFVQGDVRMLGPTGEHIVAPRQSWPRGGTLKTIGPRSAVTVTFGNGSQIEFGGNSVALNQSDNGNRRVDLEHGTARGALKKQPARHAFVLVTPEAEAIVVGTTFRLVTGGHRTRLEVTEGEVRLRRRHDGAEVAVKAGHYALVAPNTPFAATPFHADPHAVH